MGSETIIGETIIIPIDMRIEATTMSMMTNGGKVEKPISRALLSSLIIKAGTRTCSGISGVEAGERLLYPGKALNLSVLPVLT